MISELHIVYDIIMIASKSNITDDSRLDERYITQKVRQYRASAIRNKYEKYKHIEPVWLQDMGALDITEVDISNDPDFAGCDCKVGKITLPKVVNFHHDEAGVHRLSSVCRRYRFHSCSLEDFMNIPEGHLHENARWYVRMGNEVFIRPFAEQIGAVLILENPTEGFVMENEYIDNNSLVIGTVYTVVDGNITHNSIGYNTGDDFTAATTSFTGLGKVKLKTQKRSFTQNDEYPMGQTMAEEIILSILTKDLKLEESKIADVTNDSEDELLVLQKAGARR